MAYLGNNLQVAFPSYRNIDDISGSFNGVTTSFPLRVAGAAPVPLPIASNQCLISVAGVVQRPDDSGSEGFRLTGGNIVFSSAPAGGADFFGVILAGADYVHAGGQFPAGLATAPSIAFSSDSDTGLFNPAANEIAIATGGSEKLRIDSAGQLEATSLGTAAAPTYTFNTDPNTGIYSPGADQLAISTSGTQRLLIDSSGNVNIDSNTLYVDATNNRVGLGTSSPSQPLHVVGAIASTAQASSLTSSSAFIDYNTSFNGARIGSVGNTTGAAGPIYFSQYSSNASVGRDAVIIDSSGRVGIGTTSPSEALTVGSGNVQITGGQLAIGSLGSSGLQFINNGTIGTVDSIPLILRTAATERVRIDTSGRLLVGTSSDVTNGLSYAKLQVVDSAWGSLTLGTSATSIAAGTTIGDIRFYGNSGNTAAYGQFARITCEADGTASSNADNPGRLVFSTTADGASSPTERIRITQRGNIFTYSDTEGDAMAVGTARGAGTTNWLIAGVYSRTSSVTGGTQSFGVFTNGNVVNTNNSYGSLSDIKLKENIVDANSQWDDLKALQVRKYNFKEGQTHTQIGLIAQEAELICPGLVTESPDRDEDGNDLGTVTKSVNYSVLYMKAVKALQEAMDRIEQLETEMAAVKAQLS